MIPAHRDSKITDSWWIKWILWHCLGFFIVGMALFSSKETIVIMGFTALFGIQGSLMFNTSTHIFQWISISLLGLIIGFLIAYSIAPFNGFINSSNRYVNDIINAGILFIIIAFPMSLLQCIVLRNIPKASFPAWIGINIAAIFVICYLILIFSWIARDSNPHPFLMALCGIPYSLMIGSVLKTPTRSNDPFDETH